jgi:hypothetical protein
VVAGLVLSVVVAAKVVDIEMKFLSQQMPAAVVMGAWVVWLKWVMIH